MVPDFHRISLLYIAPNSRIRTGHESQQGRGLLMCSQYIVDSSVTASGDFRPALKQNSCTAIVVASLVARKQLLDEHNPSTSRGCMYALYLKFSCLLEGVSFCMRLHDENSCR